MILRSIAKPNIFSRCDFKSVKLFNLLSFRRDFEVSYELDVHSLCSDFQEDITFHFSLGWTNLMRKYLAPRNARLAILLGANVSL